MDPKQVIGTYYAFPLRNLSTDVLAKTPQEAIPQADLARMDRYPPGTQFVVYKAIAVVRNPLPPVEVVEGTLSE
jgi:hypothetical protein